MEQNSEYLAVGTRGLAKAMTPSECALPPCCTPLPSPLNSKNSLELLSSPLNSPIPCRLHHPSSLAIAWPHPSALIPTSWPYPSDSLPSHFLTLPCDWQACYPRPRVELSQKQVLTRALDYLSPPSGETFNRVRLLAALLYDCWVDALGPENLCELRTNLDSSKTSSQTLAGNRMKYRAFITGRLTILRYYTRRVLLGELV